MNAFLVFMLFAFFLKFFCMAIYYLIKHRSIKAFLLGMIIAVFWLICAAAAFNALFEIVNI